MSTECFATAKEAKRFKAPYTVGNFESNTIAMPLKINANSIHLNAYCAA